MINATKQSTSAGTVFTLAGTVDESDDFGKTFGPMEELAKSPLIVNCKDISRINSLGVKTWIKFFGSLQTRSVKFQFDQISPAIVEQANMVKNFLCGGGLISLMLPFHCEKCQTSFVGTAKKEDAKRMKYEIPDVKCPKCEGDANFDDVAEEYLAFLYRDGI